MAADPPQLVAEREHAQVAHALQHVRQLLQALEVANVRDAVAEILHLRQPQRSWPRSS